MSTLIREEGKSGALVYVCVGIIVLFFLKNIFRYLALFFMGPVRNGMVRDIRQQLFEKVLHQDLVWLTQGRKGDLIARISNDVQEVEWSIFNVLVTVFREPLVIMGSLAFLLYVSPPLTLFVFVLMLFTGIIIGGIGKSLKRKSGKVQATLGNIIAKLEENNNTSVDVERLKEIVSEFEAIRADIESTDFNASAEVLASEYVAMKKHSIELTKEFRDIVKPAFKAADKEALKLKIKSHEEDRLKVRSEKLELLKKEFQAYSVEWCN